MHGGSEGLREGTGLASSGVSGACCVTGARVRGVPVPKDGWAGPPHSHSLSPLRQREVDRNQELLTRVRQLQEREAEAEEKMKEQLERHRLCKQSLDAAGRKLREKEDGLAAAGEVRAVPGWRSSGVRRGCPGVPPAQRWVAPPPPAACPWCSRRNSSKNTHFPLRGLQFINQTLSLCNYDF